MIADAFTSVAWENIVGYVCIAAIVITYLVLKYKAARAGVKFTLFDGPGDDIE